MFTGIVEELGEVVDVQPRRLALRGPLVTSDAALGDSIAVNGVCLTVASLNDEVFYADVMDETYKRSVLGELRVGDRVNLERAATMQTRLGGHLVQGHVDGVAEILKRESAAEWESVYFRLPPGQAKYVVEKGSIAIDGTSLTVAWIEGDEFAVGLIPTTLEATTLGHKQSGDSVHIETDVTAKHLEKLLAANSERK